MIEHKLRTGGRKKRHAQAEALDPLQAAIGQYLEWIAGRWLQRLAKVLRGGSRTKPPVYEPARQIICQAVARSRKVF